MTISMTALALLACAKDKGADGKATGGGGDAPTIDLADRTVEIGAWVVKGPLPNWPFQGTSMSHKSKFEGLDDVAKLTLDFNPTGGTGVDAAKLKKDLADKKRLEMGIGKAELVKDLGEVKPGVSSFVVKRDGYSVKGQLEYTVVVLHAPPDDVKHPTYGYTGLFCTAQARFDHAAQWKQLESICTNLTFALKK